MLSTLKKCGLLKAATTSCLMVSLPAGPTGVWVEVAHLLPSHDPPGPLDPVGSFLTLSVDCVVFVYCKPADQLISALASFRAF